MKKNNTSPLRMHQLKKGHVAHIIGLDESLCGANNPYPQGVLEARLLEMGFVENAPVALLHEAPFTKDPIIVRVRNTRIALRRNEAQCVLVSLKE